MKDYTDMYSDREMITGWLNSSGRVIEVQGFYCPNGTEHDGFYNIMRDGKSAPAPSNDHPMYYIPAVGASVSGSRIHSYRAQAVKEAREFLERELQDIQDMLEDLR